MRFLELLAVTDEKQEIVILNKDKEVKEQDSCLFLWECNVHHSENILRITIKDNTMYVILGI
ncbi:hypothetical protein [Clostridium botulinum]|uniref:hypothetical protein n=1 Tax=Clostridium botulinum TaxID=1491 RepID=UPI00059CF94B|nr:hypothetical protein [Clostridium botulinum]KIN79775.1 hypothetical protein SD74_18980 [Clostridium botulinum]MCC5428830.1 hypothetical protein [Clostridium botulinum]HCL4447303.1 hypothetical protein [Clostridium botulinum]HCL4455287.1 hypothetical protein [Clostridium botulinum]